MIRVEVASHFNEDAFSHGLAQGLADRLRERLSGYRCPSHGGGQEIRLSTEGIAQTANDIRVEIRGCCDPAVAEVGSLVAAIRTEIRR